MPKAFARYTDTGYRGVFFILGTSPLTGDPERIYYIRYKDPSGKLVEEPVGRTGKPDNMTAAKANTIRSYRVRGLELPNRKQREAKKEEHAAEAKRWTFDKLWEEWLRLNPHKKGKVNDDNRYRLHLRGPFGNKEPRELVPLDVDRLRLRLLKSGSLPGRKLDPNAKRRDDYSEKTRREFEERSAKREAKPYAVDTVRSILSLLTRIANFGVKRQLCEGLRFKVEGPKGTKQRTEDMTEEQMARYIRMCRTWPDPQAGDFQLLEIFTGMRRGEVRNLRWADVDYERGFLLLRDPKGGKDQRIPMSGAARKLLKKHPEVKDNPYVFAGEEGGPRSIRNIADSSRAIRDAAGLPKDFRPNHGLRHTFASHLASSGEVDLYVLQRLLTHKSPQMTQRYAHLRDQALQKAAGVIDAIVSRAGGDPDQGEGEVSG